ncbi:MAG: Crp/Fnr family transcriptional regulator [Rhodospirillaceae bacterium]|jgi:CRP/FNR family transcriptional regulator, cyclic AMP receptor protein|nr:Crp/Fnr family transcriptional regulator [Rhodospirillaceae bacterium]MBT4115553.1 Crp/Fnr family transcriptional regulator [Rhodospirillaceae bacterium]MBT4672421.1 Crp/Fnr family transcriptional regulator [Rhodospirillaceae bacterium]MBT5181122.1 Crp/Fnr family transcriptional regulator [Rhodospirillaceae bacterium]MBT5840522.1 Crp/Fnr family transcriptional regulator [Rhodospirillaceae bacterium]
MAKAPSQIMQRLVLQPGHILFNEGEFGNEAYVIQAGRVEIVKIQGDEELVLGAVEKGGIFGEMALIDSRPRMAMARAAAATTVVVIPRDLFSSKVAKCDPFVRCLIGSYAKLIRSLV